MSNILQRRDFIKKVAATGIGLGISSVSGPFILANGSANEKLVVGIMGTNARGAALAQGFAKLPGAEVAYICDVDDQAIAKGIEGTIKGGQKKNLKE
jgi:hypothetical protein